MKILKNLIFNPISPGGRVKDPQLFPFAIANLLSISTMRSNFLNFPSLKSRSFLEEFEQNWCPQLKMATISKRRSATVCTPLVQAQKAQTLACLAAKFCHNELPQLALRIASELTASYCSFQT